MFHCVCSHDAHRVLCVCLSHYLPHQVRPCRDLPDSQSNIFSARHLTVSHFALSLTLTHSQNHYHLYLLL